MENVKYTIYVEECPPDCGMFNCPRCWEAGAAMMRGMEVVRTESLEKRKARWHAENEKALAGNAYRRGRTMDLPFRYDEAYNGFVVINGGKSNGQYRARDYLDTDPTPVYVGDDFWNRRGRR